MEVMEEGDLMDRVPVLLNRDMQYYQNHQSVLQENICAGIVGGKLDFPRYASFAAVKIVLWWEDEYFAAYKKNSGLLHMDEINDDDFNEEVGLETQTVNARVIVKTSDPEKFVGSITKSADKLLEHIHTLSQEALDHADLTVLTATIGAAALVKNSLWVYLHSVTKSVCPPKGDEAGGSLKLSYKQFSEMTEALAERLLDLHCRLLSLYIIQDADCLHWESPQPFFESERGSYTVQMWWLYIQGTKQNLWNSVPPNMAQRVLAGMLNETLSILTVRYAQTMPSEKRSTLLLVDVCNMLLCVAELLASISESGEAYVGLNITNQSKIIRDVHAKCQELFCCLLLRGVPLGTLYKVLQKGTAAVEMFNSRQGLPSPWIVFALPKLFPSGQSGQWANSTLDFGANTAVALELKILLNSPQANWALLLKILLMRDAVLTCKIFQQLLGNIPTDDCFVSALDQPFMARARNVSKCNGFMCGKECNKLGEWISEQQDPIGQANYQTVLALTYIVVLTGKTFDINATLIAALHKGANRLWASCLDRRQVWSQKRPPWFDAILHFVYPVLDPVVHMLVSAVQTGASMYQAMALAISCLSEMWDCIPDCLYTVASSLTDILPTDVKPLGGSVLIQILFAALYTKLMEATVQEPIDPADAQLAPQKILPKNPNLNKSDPFAVTPKMSPKASICNLLAEAICSIDEDHKHTDALQTLINQARESQRSTEMAGDNSDTDEAAGLSFVSTLKLDDATCTNNSPMMDDNPSPSTRTAEEYDVESAEYIAELLVSDVLVTSVGKQCLKMMYSYLRNNAEWLLQQLGVSDIESSEFQPLPGQSVTEEKPTLLTMMFHIGHQPFDQLLTGSLRIDYDKWLLTPMSLTPERAWLQISQRYEFQVGTKLSVQDTVMVAAITAKCK